MEENHRTGGMNPLTPGIELKKRRSPLQITGISLIAAVAMITILSFTIFSGVLRPAPQTTNNTSTITGSQNHQQQQQQQRVISTGKQVCSLNAGSNVWTNGTPWSADPAWSSQGQLAVTTYQGVKVYSAKDCKATSFSQPQILQAYSPLWSPDGSKLFVSDGGDMGEYVLDSNGKIIAKLKDHFIGERLWSSDGKNLIGTNKFPSLKTMSAEERKSLIKDNGSIKMTIVAVDASGGNKETILSQTSGGIVEGFSANGKMALIRHTVEIAKDKERSDAIIWDINAGKQVGHVSFPEPTYDQQLSPDGSLLAGRDGDKIVIYTTADGKLLTSIENKVAGESVDTLAWSPDGKYLAESTNNIAIYDIAAKKLATKFGQVDAKHSIDRFIWSPDGTGIASSSIMVDNAAMPSPSDLTVSVWALS